MASFVNPKQVQEFRTLHFSSIDECIAEINRLVAADSKGTLRHLANWTPGQIMFHLAAWIEYGYDGYPIAPPPRFIRWILRLGLSRMLRKGMSRGVRIPGIKEGTVGIEDMPTTAAAERLINAMNRLRSGEESEFDSPAFGPMSHDDRIRLNLRHAELHLGYLSDSKR